MTDTARTNERRRERVRPLRPGPEILGRMYEIMTTARQNEERVRTLVMSGVLRMTCHSPRGQEAIAAGVAAALEPQDVVVTTYRGMHDQIAKGVPLRRLWGEYFGKDTGACRGRGGGMHISDRSIGLMMTTGIVGSGLPVAVGLALACRLQKNDAIAVANFGDGASDIGAFHESLNLAQLWELPVIFVCQNNRFAEHTALADHQMIQRISDRAAAYGMRGVTVDGNYPVEVWSTISEAANRARRGDGPTLVEAMTWRQGGHHIADSAKYMPKEFLADARAADPLPRFREALARQGAFTVDDLDAIDAKVAAAIDDAVAFALDSPLPSADGVGNFVYKDSLS